MDDSRSPTGMLRTNAFCQISQPGLGGCTENVLFNLRNKTLSVPPISYVPPTSKQLQQNKWRQIHPPYWSNIRQVALGNLECR
jgi:hypothetical protein